MGKIISIEKWKIEKKEKEVKIVINNFLENKIKIKEEFKKIKEKLKAVNLEPEDEAKLAKIINLSKINK